MDGPSKPGSGGPGARAVFLWSVMDGSVEADRGLGGRSAFTVAGPGSVEAAPPDVETGGIAAIGWLLISSGGAKMAFTGRTPKSGVASDT